ncbi:MAG: sulfur oxidation c-type cytochrome SoxX [Proteobacteria bacterium]|nr:sulfur oxidation c-type cytochrome SoxX [Pseudomonadota bacterium]
MSRRSNDKLLMRNLFGTCALAVVAALFQWITPVRADPRADAIERPSAEVMARALKSIWPNPKAGWEKRIEQDDTQSSCSRYRNDPPSEEAKAITERETARIVLPTDGKVLGDWKAGEKIASSGRGGQFSDPPGTENGGNCYACHQLAKSEVAYGTLGPSLTNYGKDRGYSLDAAKAAYAKIFDSEATFACSNMPRFGIHGFLSEQQIKDVVAFLFDKESPVNK